MSRYAIVDNTKVVNVVEWDGQSNWHPGEGLIAVAVPEGKAVEIGDTYQAGTFTTT